MICVSEQSEKTCTVEDPELVEGTVAEASGAK